VPCFAKANLFALLGKAQITNLHREGFAGGFTGSLLNGGNLGETR
jgi:hypothetical protein